MIETFENDYDVHCIHAWGMTEMSPLGTVCRIKGNMIDRSDEQLMATKVKQGRPIYGVDLKIVGDDGEDLAHDGEIFGELCVKGPWVASGYFDDDTASQAALADGGWFRTGDVVTIDEDGYVQIVDRSKDVIKSGGEWISSIELENIAVGHGDVAEAAVIGLDHDKWGERPLLVVVKSDGGAADAAEILKIYDGKVAKFCIPDAVEFVDELPHTATGKIQKMTLRERFADYRFAE